MRQAPAINPARRRFLKSAATGAAGMALAHALPALAATAGAPLTATPLSERLRLISGAGGNVLALSTNEGILMVDGGEAAHAPALLEQIAGSRDTRRIRMQINTHWHPEHTGANDLLGAQGTRILAHENTKLWMTTDIDLPWQGKMYPPRAPVAWPTETTYTDGQVDFGGQTVRYGYLPQAHTDGDLYVFFPAENVMAAGDVLGGAQYPILDWCTGGWIGGLLNATKALLDLTDASTRFIAGQGAVLSRADVEAQHEMLTAIRGKLVAMIKKGASLDEMMAAAPTKDFDARWGDPNLLMTNAYPGLLGHVRELGGIL
ncbi:MAG: MBL fold metallo-hydrolase [Nevskiaceae bacterium]|jgi:glyoxylase-like metal-dependent hydrolase (beta-lactamase superfamily II)|nr:MBL fold metallo-hydrolase [Nevskiaceae bacterium]